MIQRRLRFCIKLNRPPVVSVPLIRELLNLGASSFYHEVSGND